jgi:hypothetical protein
MNQKPTFWNADKIVSLSAILISLATMGVYIYQTHLIQKQQNASVMPYLMIATSSHNENHFNVGVVNNGLGPAFIEEINIHFLGKEYKNCDLAKYFYNYNPKKDTLYFMNSSIVSGMVIPSGKTIINVEADNKESASKLKKYFWSEKGIDVEILYSSIYGEKWVAKYSLPHPKKIDD